MKIGIRDQAILGMVLDPWQFAVDSVHRGNAVVTIAPSSKALASGRTVLGLIPLIPPVFRIHARNHNL